jgi:hypothetical protein
VRLDHLLSTELISCVQQAEARPVPYAHRVVAHGWNIDEELVRPGAGISTCSCLPRGGSVVERAGRGGAGLLSTLLGPEATGHAWSVVSVRVIAVPPDRRPNPS